MAAAAKGSRRAQDAAVMACGRPDGRAAEDSSRDAAANGRRDGRVSPPELGPDLGGQFRHWGGGLVLEEGGEEERGQLVVVCCPVLLPLLLLFPGYCNSTHKVKFRGGLID